MPKPRVGGQGPHRSTADNDFADTMATLVVNDTKATIIRGDYDPEAGDDLVVAFNQLGRRYGSALNLTQLTAKELTAFREFINRAIDLAEPVVRQRDEEADHAFNEGNDTFERIYRAVPQLVYREGAVETYCKSLFERPDDLPDGERDGDGESD